MSKKKIGILTGGGDVAPLNAVINSVKDEALKNNIDVIGFKNGWHGLLCEEYINLSDLEINPSIGGTILKSSRVNLAKVENGADTVREKFRKLNLDGLIVIGGEDTLSNAFHLRDLPIVLISKTIDNDVGINEKDNLVNYFTLGYPTAAAKISSFVSLQEGVRTTAYSHERIIVVESMGMHAGWLALSSSMGNPDFIIIPEFPLDFDDFKEKVKNRYLENKNVIIVLAEGSRWKNGDHISADESEKDSFGHPKFKGASEVLAKRLKTELKEFFDTRNVNSVNPSYLYRSGKPSTLDFNAGQLLGCTAVDILCKGLKSVLFLSINYKEKQLEVKPLTIDNLKDIEQFHRFIDERFYNHKEYSATAEAKKYLSEMIPELQTSDYGF